MKRLKHKLLFLLLTLGLCETGATTSTHTARAPVCEPAPAKRTARISRRPKRSPNHVQVVTAEPSFATAPITAAEVPKKHYFSGTVIQIATGLNAGFASTNTDQTGSTRNALVFSVMVEKRLSEHFYLCPELAYAQRGVQTNLFSIGGTNVVGAVMLNYLELPVLLKTKFTIAPKTKLFFVGGPTLGLVLTRQVEVMGIVNLDLSSRFRQVDFGVVVGTGIEYQITPDFALTSHLRSQFGLVNLDTTPDRVFNTRGFQLLVGAQFKL